MVIKIIHIIMVQNPAYSDLILDFLVRLLQSKTC